MSLEELNIAEMFENVEDLKMLYDSLSKLMKESCDSDKKVESSYRLSIDESKKWFKDSFSIKEDKRSKKEVMKFF